MVGVVEANSHDLAGPLDRGEQRDGSKVDIRGPAFAQSEVPAQRVEAFHQGDHVARRFGEMAGDLDEAIPRNNPQPFLTGVFVPRDLHRASSRFPRFGTVCRSDRATRANGKANRPSGQQ